jgi:hypothetical protein
VFIRPGDAATPLNGIRGTEDRAAIADRYVIAVTVGDGFERASCRKRISPLPIVQRVSSALRGTSRRGSDTREKDCKTGEKASFHVFGRMERSV